MKQILVQLFPAIGIILMLLINMKLSVIRHADRFNDHDNRNAQKENS